jgi:ribosomal protein S18 acetylase RimI-like enzyme
MVLRSSPGSVPAVASVRQARDDDYDAVCALYRQADALHAAHLPGVFRPPAEHPRTREFFRHAIDSATTVLLVAAVEGTPAGFVRVEVRSAPDVPFFEPRRFAQVEELVVDERFRRRGVGRLLMAHAHRWALDRGLRRVELTVWEFNRAALALYEELGYAPVMRRLVHELEPGEADY